MADEEMSLSDEMSLLMQGTQAHLVSDVSAAVMHDRQKIETPIPELNCIFGGGIPMGIIIEAFGSPATGKSSTWYQTMGNFQKQYPGGVSIIVDTEASVDRERMPFMGCDPNRTMRIPATSIESGFGQVFSILDKKSSNEKLKNLPVFIIWDTIGIGVTEKEMTSGSDQFASGMMAHAKLLKHELSLLLPRIEKQPIVVVLLNQVTTEVGQFRSGLTSGGGWGIKHNAHLRLYYADGKTDYDGIYAVTKHSSLNIVKSKISPLFNNLPLIIDITKGGTVDPVGSFLSYVTDSLGYIKVGSWDKFDIKDRHPEFQSKFGIFNKSFRYNELYNLCKEDPRILYFLEVLFIEDISKVYSYQADVCRPYLEELWNKATEGLGLNQEETNNTTNITNTTDIAVEQSSEVTTENNLDASALN